MIAGISMPMTTYGETNAAGIEITIQDDNPLSSTLNNPNLNNRSNNVSATEQQNIATPRADQIAPEAGYVFNPNNANPLVKNELATKSESNNETQKQNLAADSANTPEIRQRIIDGYAMQNVASSRSAQHEAWYAKRPDYIKRMMERSQKYLYFIVGEVEKRGMPTEIALLPMIESAFNPQAYSTSRASGIWQFIPSTGKHFGLEQNFWKDNRRNVTAATGAALTYLQKLHGMFGSWELALAAYNAGEGTVQRAINRNKKLGLPTDYASLSLPVETQQYVPKLQAIKNIMTNPEEFGLNIAPINNTPYFAKVTAPDRIDAKLAASFAEISMDEFNALNPEHKRPILSGGKGSHEILLPINSVAAFNNNLNNYTKPLVSWQTYQAKRGENIGLVAQKFGMNVGELREVNQLSSKKNKLNNNMPLLVASNGEQAVDTELTDNFESVQAEPNTSEHDAHSSLLSEKKSHQSVKYHIVKKHETLKTIAKKYGVTVAALKADNSIKSSKIKPGQNLEIPHQKISVADNAKSRSNRTKIKSSTHKYLVKRGDTLAEIAVKFDVSSTDIKRWNKLKNSNIQPGKKLTIVRS